MLALLMPFILKIAPTIIEAYTKHRELTGEDVRNATPEEQERIFATALAQTLQEGDTEWAAYKAGKGW